MKKILSVILAVSMMLSLITFSAFADDSYREVGTVQSFIDCLSQDGDVNIKIVSQIIHTCTAKKAGEYWITLGKGKKTIDLNGFSVELNAETNGGLLKTTMLRIPTGAELVINDSSGDNSGKLFCYGMIEHPEEYGIYYQNAEVKYRNVAEVSGGILTVNGGTLEAGRSKEIWIYNGCDVLDWKVQLQKTLEFGALGKAIGTRFDGYAYQQINGDCITLKDGTVTIYDGIFLGRGYSRLEAHFNSMANFELEGEKSAVIRAEKGTLNILGGEFHGKGNADVFALSKNAFNGGDIEGTIRAGTFQTQYLKIVNVPSLNSSINIADHPMIIGKSKSLTTDAMHAQHYLAHVGNINLPVDALDPQRNTVEIDGKVLPSSEWSPKTLKNTSSDKGGITLVLTHHTTNSDRRAYVSGAKAKQISSAAILGTMAQGIELNDGILKLSADNVRKMDVEWYHNGSLAGDETFVVAGDYQAKATLIAASGYEFSKDASFAIIGSTPQKVEISENGRRAYVWSKVYSFDCNHSYNEDEYLHFDTDKHFLKCSVCDKIISEEEHYFGDGEKNEDVITYKCRRCDYAYEELDDGKIKITYFNIALPEPETGKTPDYSGVVGNDGVSFADGGDEYTKNGIRWGKYANDFGIGENDLFASGLRYRVTVFLKANEGYAFHKNYKGEYDTAVFVNGEEAKYEVDGDLMKVTYEVNAPEVVVSSVDMMGIDYPEIGNTPDCTPESAIPYYYGAKKDSGAITWYEDGKYMDKTDTFKAGKTYSVEMYVDAVRVGWDDVVTFSDAPVASLDGFSIDAENVKRLNNTTVLMSYTFPILEEEKEFEKEPETEKEPKEDTESNQQKAGENNNSEVVNPETGKNTFTDVKKEAYYYEPVMWAVENGIASGTSANTFSPDANCTRAQVVTFLWRMVASPEPAAIDNPFVDVKADSYYYKPVMWAVGSKITGGTSATTFSPDDTCTRAQVVTFLWRTAGQPKPKGSVNPFTDVKADSYYYDAVLWAVENQITGGTSAATFSPDTNCTRGQVVTFLYRFINR